MTSDPETPVGTTGGIVAIDNDSTAERYAAETESSLVDGYYTRPAMLEPAAEVAGQQILEVGCAAGPLLSSLRDLMRCRSRPLALPS